MDARLKSICLAAKTHRHGLVLQGKACSHTVLALDHSKIQKLGQIWAAFGAKVQAAGYVGCRAGWD